MSQTNGLEGSSRLKLKFVVQSAKGHQGGSQGLPQARLPSGEFLSPTKLKLKFTAPPLEPPASDNDAPSLTETEAKKPTSRTPKFIADRSSRIRSYQNRRHAPFRKVFDLDLQCGTVSLLVQICDDTEECLYFGDQSLVEKFLHTDGIKVQQLTELIQDAKKKRDSADTINSDPRSGNSSNTQAGPSVVRRKSVANVMTGEDSNDDDYTPTVKEKKEIAKEKRKEMQQKLQDGEYLANASERNQVFQSRKDLLVAKIRENDAVCGTRSFLLILNLDQEAAAYHGDPGLLTQFFTTGLTFKTLGKSYNIRMFEIDEIDLSKCSVPHCLVSRNQLSRWRLAAIQLFKFPDHLPVTLYPCPEAERDRWIAELQLDPNFSGKIAVCSLHFKEGLPTSEFPFPSEMLSPKDSEITEFRGSKPPPEVTSQEIEISNETKSENAEKLKKSEESEKPVKPVCPYKNIVIKNRVRKRGKQTSWKKCRTFLFSKVKSRISRTDLKNRKYSNKTGDFQRKIRFSLKSVTSVYGSRILCKFCSKKFFGTRKYFEHVRQDHFKISESLTKDAKPSTEITATEVTEPKTTTIELSLEPKVAKPKPVNLSQTELTRYLEIFYPDSGVKHLNPRKKYVCATCKSTYDLFGLYLHMKKVHDGVLCMYCLKLFKKVTEIENHLKNHKLKKWYYHTPKLFASYSGLFYSFVCSICNELISGKDLELHKCNRVGPKVFDCPNCDRTFPHQKPLDIHISNGWCKLNKRPGFEAITDENEAARRFKALTGKDPTFELLKSQKIKSVDVKVELAKKTEKEIIPVSTVPAKKEKQLKFNVSDRQILYKYCTELSKSVKPKKEEHILEDLPDTGTIFCGMRARGVGPEIRKQVRESGRIWNIKDELQKSGKNVESQNTEFLRAGSNFFLDSKLLRASQIGSEIDHSDSDVPRSSIDDDTAESGTDPNSELPKLKSDKKVANEKHNVSIKISLPAKKESKSERILRHANEISNCLAKLCQVVDHFGDDKGCLFCQQARVVTVDTVFLLSHLIIVHDRDEVESRLAENAESAILRIRTHLKDTRKEEVVFKYKGKDDHDQKDLVYSCCYCPTKIKNDYNQLFSHLHLQHKSKVLNCHLCQNIFLNYGSFVSHVCFGPIQQVNTLTKARAKFVCPICGRDDLAAFLDFQFHVRKHHNVCEICLQPCSKQEDLYSHCLTHSQELMCMKCFLTYDDLKQFRKHLFYKHEQEHTVCKECHQKTWAHVYHFCIQPSGAICEVCDKDFESLKQYRVHIRTHTGSNPYACSARGCNKSYISKQLLLKHHVRRHPELRGNAAKTLEDRRNHRLLNKFGAKSIDGLRIVENILHDIVDGAVTVSETPTPPPEPESPEKIEPVEDKSKVSTNDNSTTYLDPVDAAVRSIMGPEGSFSFDISPTKPLSSIIPPAQLPMQTPVPPPPPIQLELPKVMPVPEIVVPPPRVATPSGFSPPLMVVRSQEAKTNLSVINNTNNQDADTSATEEAVSDGSSPVIAEKNKLTNGHDRSSEDQETDPAASAKSRPVNPVLDGIWNQDLFFLSKPADQQPSADAPPKKGCKVMMPRFQGHMVSGVRALPPVKSKEPRTLTHFDATTISKKLGTGGWDVLLSESSDSENEGKMPRQVRIIERVMLDKREVLRDHDYCFEAFAITQMPPSPPPGLVPTKSPVGDDLSEMDKIANDVAMGVAFESGTGNSKKRDKKRKEGKKKKKKKKKHKKKHDSRNSSSSDSDSEVDVTSATEGKVRKPLASSTPAPALQRKGPKPKYHNSMTGQGVTAGTARPRFSSSSDDEFSSNDDLSDGALATSDLDTDFSADEVVPTTTMTRRAAKPTPKIAALKDANNDFDLSDEESSKVSTPALKLKIKLPSTNQSGDSETPKRNKKNELQLQNKKGKKGQQQQPPVSSSKSKKRRRSQDHYEFGDWEPSAKKKPWSKAGDSSSNDSDTSEPNLAIEENFSGVPQEATTNDKLYCVCQCPHDDVSEMIGCDAPDCRLEWFHFECVGIMVPPKGRWYCPECQDRYRIKDRNFL